MIVIISFSYSTPMTTSFWFYRKTAVPFVENLRNIFNTWLLKIPWSDIAWSYGPRWCHKRVIRSRLPITWPSQRFPSNRPCLFTVVGLIELCLKGSLKVKISSVNSLPRFTQYVLYSSFLAVDKETGPFVFSWYRIEPQIRNRSIHSVV